MRIWFSGPRVMNGLVRPGVSFGPEDFRKAERQATALPKPEPTFFDMLAMYAVLLGSLLLLGLICFGAAMFGLAMLHLI